MVEIIHLQGIDGRLVLEVDDSPLVSGVAGGEPVALAVLVRQVRRFEGGRGLGTAPLREALRLSGAALLPAGGGDRFVQRQQHPAREGALPALDGRCEMGIIAEARVRPHYAVLIEEGRVGAEAALPVHDRGQRHGCIVPELAAGALHRAAVAGAAHVAARFVGERVVRLVGVRAERVLRSVHAVAIDIEFSAGRGIFHIVGIAVLC